MYIIFIYMIKPHYGQALETSLSPGPCDMVPATSHHTATGTTWPQSSPKFLDHNLDDLLDKKLDFQPQLNRHKETRATR